MKDDPLWVQQAKAAGTWGQGVSPEVAAEIEADPYCRCSKLKTEPPPFGGCVWHEARAQPEATVHTRLYGQCEQCVADGERDARRRERERLEGEGPMTVRPIFAWFDLWVGAFWDRNARKLYVFPIPCVGVVLTFRPKQVTT